MIKKSELFTEMFVKNYIKLGTHNGQFHADDVLSYILLKWCFKNSKLKLYRTRDTKILEKADIVFDVFNTKFDHHSKNAPVRENGIKYASLGLLWKEFSIDFLMNNWSLTEDDAEEVSKKVDKVFITQLDAADNGTGILGGAYGLHQMISDMNPKWNEDKDADIAFMEAVKRYEPTFNDMIKSVISRMKVKPYVISKFKERTNSHILILDKGCEWKSTLYEIDKNEEILYVIHPSSTGDYNIVAVNLSNDTFELRKPFPVEWRGKKNSVLNDAVGMNIKDAIFCHDAGFLSVAKSFESALKMAKYSVEYQYKFNI